MRHASALKAHRKSLVRKASNVKIRSRARTLTKTVLKAISEKNVESATAKFREAQSIWRKAAKKNIFHEKAANRQISKMATRLAVLAKS